MLSAKRTIIAGATALCLFAPLPAQAQDLRGADARGAPTAVQPRSQDLRGADSRGAPIAVQPPSQDLRGADSRGAPAAPERPLDVEPAPRVRIVEVPSSGLEWGDAIIGAAGMLAIVALAVAAGLAVTRRRSVTTG
jgi:hypothetical protein